MMVTDTPETVNIGDCSTIRYWQYTVKRKEKLPGVMTKQKKVIYLPTGKTGPSGYVTAYGLTPAMV